MPARGSLSPARTELRSGGQGAGGAAPGGRGGGRGVPRGGRAARPLQERGRLRPPQRRGLPRLFSLRLSQRVASPLTPPNFTLILECAWLVSHDVPVLPVGKAERRPYDLCVAS